MGLFFIRSASGAKSVQLETTFIKSSNLFIIGNENWTINLCCTHIILLLNWLLLRNSTTSKASSSNTVYIYVQDFQTICVRLIASVRRQRTNGTLLNGLIAFWHLTSLYVMKKATEIFQIHDVAWGNINNFRKPTAAARPYIEKMKLHWWQRIPYCNSSWNV